MAALVVNAIADRDIGEILDLIAQAAGVTAATRFDRSFDALFVRLMGFPESGAPRPSLGNGIRIGVVRPYVVIYRFDAANDLVEILRVLHGHREVKPDLLSP